MGSDAPYVSIVIPVYNEEKILLESLSELREKLRALPWTYEILVSENGSRERHVGHSRGDPNYGKAMREGILRARGRFVICDEIDLCDVDFYTRAMALLERGEA